MRMGIVTAQQSVRCPDITEASPFQEEFAVGQHLNWIAIFSQIGR